MIDPRAQALLISSTPPAARVVLALVEIGIAAERGAISAAVGGMGWDKPGFGFGTAWMELPGGASRARVLADLNDWKVKLAYRPPAAQIGNAEWGTQQGGIRALIQSALSDYMATHDERIYPSASLDKLVADLVSSAKALPADVIKAGLTPVGAKAAAEYIADVILPPGKPDRFPWAAAIVAVLAVGGLIYLARS